MDNINLIESQVVTGVDLLTLMSSKNNKPYKVLEITFTAFDEKFTKRVFLEQAEIAMVTAQAKLHYAENDVNDKE